jgi:hypothetical protein
MINMSLVLSDFCTTLYMANIQIFLYRFRKIRSAATEKSYSQKLLFLPRTTYNHSAAVKILY